MAKIYVIDSENVGDSWVQLLDSMSDEDRMYVYYTDHSPYLSYESLLQVIGNGRIPSFVKCFEGKNALDFQMVSELGYQMALTPSAEYVIVSDDNGFDVVIKHWTEKNYRLRRIGRKFCRNIPLSKKAESSNEKEKGTSDAAGEEAAFAETAGVTAVSIEEAYPLDRKLTPVQQTIRDIVYECRTVNPEEDWKCAYHIFYSLSMATLTEVNTALKLLIGNEDGNTIYRELKERQECRRALDDLYLPSQRERFFHYVGVVLRKSELGEPAPEELAKFLISIPRKNLNSIRSSLQKEFGHDLGSRIYAVYRPHIKILNSIVKTE